jgi:hypothetical protein
VLAGDVAEELGLAEGGSDLDQLDGAGAAVELAGAVLAVLALDCGCSCWTSAALAVRARPGGRLDRHIERMSKEHPGARLHPCRCGAVAVDPGARPDRGGERAHEAPRRSLAAAAP